VRGSPPLERVDRLPRIAWIVSLEALGSTLLKRVDRLPWSALIASLGARGSPPSERVDVPCVALMGSLEHRPAARSCGCTRLREHASQTSTKRAATARRRNAPARRKQNFSFLKFWNLGNWYDLEIVPDRSSAGPDNGGTRTHRELRELATGRRDDNGTSLSAGSFTPDVFPAPRRKRELAAARRRRSSRPRWISVSRRFPASSAQHVQRFSPCR
jgi:hypothetical protein